MKTITREKQIVEKYELFVAEDGTEFKDMAECQKYEESAEGVLSAKYHPLVVGTTTEYNIYDTGREENKVELVKVASKADADIILQMYFLKNTYIKRGLEEGKEDSIKRVNEVKRCINAAKESGEPLLVNRGYDDDGLWIMGTYSTICEDIQNNIKKAMSAE
jgi:hypothetical protein